MIERSARNELALVESFTSYLTIAPAIQNCSGASPTETPSRRPECHEHLHWTGIDSGIPSSLIWHEVVMAVPTGFEPVASAFGADW